MALLSYSYTTVILPASILPASSPPRSAESSQRIGHGKRGGLHGSGQIDNVQLSLTVMLGLGRECQPSATIANSRIYKGSRRPVIQQESKQGRCAAIRTV